MSDILQDIAQNKQREIASLYNNERRHRMLEVFYANVPKIEPSLSFSESIRLRNAASMPGIIAEFKRRSPSKGDIVPMADVVSTIHAYEGGGAAACSILTDTRYFGGALTDLVVARQQTSLPLLRKDFIIDEIQVCEAFFAGANAILLIGALLTLEKAEQLTRMAHNAGMEVLFEIHDANELDRMPHDVDMLGVNNRRLATFTTNVNHSREIASALPRDKVLVAESGIKNREDVRRLSEVGFHGFLIGETLMRAENTQAMLADLLGI